MFCIIKTPFTIYYELLALPNLCKPWLLQYKHKMLSQNSKDGFEIDFVTPLLYISIIYIRNNHLNIYCIIKTFKCEQCSIITTLANYGGQHCPLIPALIVVDSILINIIATILQLLHGSNTIVHL